MNQDQHDPCRSLGFGASLDIGHWSLVIFLIPLLAIASGCRSSKPPPPQPRSITEANRSAEEAAKLQAARNWSSAASEWKKAADEYFLINDLTNAAIALHNLGQAERELAQYDSARKDIEQAAQLNERLRRTDEWFRNQLALLQVDSLAGRTNQLGDRFDKLSSRADQIREPSLRGTFLIEVGLYEQGRGELAKAMETFQRAAGEFDRARDRFGTATVLANEAKLFEQQMNYPAAMDAWHAALVLFEALADPPGVTRCLQGLGRTLLLANMDLPKAEQYLRQALRNLRTLHNEAAAQETEELLQRSLRAQGRAEKL